LRLLGEAMARDNKEPNRASKQTRASNEPTHCVANKPKQGAYE
jgi:hypothetical protein